MKTDLNLTKLSWFLLPHHPNHHHCHSCTVSHWYWHWDPKLGWDYDQHDDVDDETGEGGRRGAPHPWQGFAKRSRQVPPSQIHSHPRQVLKMRTNFSRGLDWRGALNETVGCTRVRMLVVLLRRVWGLRLARLDWRGGLRFMPEADRVQAEAEEEWAE